MKVKSKSRRLGNCHQCLKQDVGTEYFEFVSVGVQVTSERLQESGVVEVKEKEGGNRYLVTAEEVDQMGC